MHKLAVEALSMSNAKVLMPNEIQIVKVKTRIPREDLKFDIDLTLPACAKPRLPKPRAAGRRFGEGRDFDI
jgi:hypothetical protein